MDDVKRRQHVRALVSGEKIAAGKRSAGGQAPRYLFSGLMRCEACGSSFVMKDRHSYQCAGFVNGRVCSNGLRVRRDMLEERLLTNIKAGLLSEEAVRRFTAKMRRRLTQHPADPAAQRRKTLQAEVEHLVAAIGKGLLSAALSKRLQDAEAELAALPPPATAVKVDDVLRKLPEAVQRMRRMVARLSEAPIDVERGRELLRGLLGDIRIEPRDGYLVAKMGLELQPLSGSSIRGSGGRI